MRGQTLTKVRRSLETYSQSWLNSTIHRRLDWPRKKLSDLARVQTGRAKNKKKQIPVVSQLTVPYLRVANVQDGYLDLAEMKTLTIDEKEFDRYSVLPGDVLMNEGGDHDKLGRGHIWNGEIDKCIHQNHVFVVRPGEDLLPEYLSLVGRSNYGKSYFLSRAKKTSNLASMNSTQLKALSVPLPNLNMQQSITSKSKELDIRKNAVLDNLDSAKALQKSLINQIF